MLVYSLIGGLLAGTVGLVWAYRKPYEDPAVILFVAIIAGLFWPIAGAIALFFYIVRNIQAKEKIRRFGDNK